MQPTIEDIISLCKRRGFVYQSAEIYGGLNGIYDLGPMGTKLSKNLKKEWLNSLLKAQENILEFDGAILGPQAVWKASGHIEEFNDPMVDCLNCKHRYRADEIDLTQPCPHCGKKAWTDVRQFNMMFSTQVGASAEHAATAYLRPETAQSIFINFKNIITTNRVKLPFGVAQIGKAFRNEITPKQFLFRVREFEQMEMEWFCRPENANTWFEFWKEERFRFYTEILKLDPKHLRLRTHEENERSHYSQNTCDVEYEFPFGWKELEGIADRGNYDLKQHSQYSGKDLSVYDEQAKESFIPYVVETSAGVGRTFFTVLFDAFKEETIEDETRIVLQLAPRIAPIKAAFLPLSKKLSEPMCNLFKSVKKQGFQVEFDDSGSIGKRYRRQDEIGTPLCFTYDFGSETDNSVTVRHRDSMEQERVSFDSVSDIIAQALEE